MEKSPVLFVVHPGSACRSADFNLGEEAGKRGRESLIADLEAWQGGIIVIDSSLSRDLGQRRFHALGVAITAALQRARSAGLIADQIRGCDWSEIKNQTWAAGQMLQRHNLTPERHRIELTGAWYNPDGLSGCVNDVRRVFDRRGFEASVRDSAVREPRPEPEPSPPGP